MLILNDVELTIQKLIITEAFTNAEEERRFKAELQLTADLSDAELESLPDRVQAGVRELLKSSRAAEGEEGKNSVHVGVKFTFDDARYHFGDQSFVGEVLRAPKISIVEGALAVRWAVRTSLDQDQLTHLAGWVDNGECMFSMTPLQGELALAA